MLGVLLCVIDEKEATQRISGKCYGLLGPARVQSLYCYVI